MSDERAGASRPPRVGISSCFFHPDLERPFKIPGYPVTPILTILVCFYIMYGLAAITWVIFLTWIALCLIFYFVYGRTHATLNHYTSDEEIAEPSGRHLKEDEQL